MTEYHKIVLSGEKATKRLDKTFSWERHLNSFEQGETSFIPLDAFNTNLLVHLTDTVEEGLIFEIVVHDYDHCTVDEIRWFAKVEKVCGYRVLAQHIGSSAKFWVNILSEDVMYLAKAPMTDPSMSNVTYAPPLPINEAHKDDMQNFINNVDVEFLGKPSLGPIYEEIKLKLDKPRFRVGQRLELLNYNYSTQIRVARIQGICGRRLNVLVTEQDFDGKVPDANADRQFKIPGAEYWIDEGSFFIFPVGFASLNNYKLVAKQEYVDHTTNIAEAIKKGEKPEYHADDITFEELPKKFVDQTHWSQLKKGQKFELVDPLSQKFQNLKVATILDFLPSNGYIVVGMDGPDQEMDRFPIHIYNLFMFPVGYAEEYGINLNAPEGYKGTFKWDEYLKKEKAEALPLHLFRTEPSQERLDKFKVGMKLEAADMCENQLICPATIKSVHGRIINVHWDGWSDEFDELYDIDSHDILPIGWCEFHNYVLQEPTEPTQPTAP